MPRKKDDEEYCEDCGELLENCECDEEEDYEDEKSKKREEDKKKHKKWIIETIIKIAVPIVVALIGVGFFLLKH